MHRRRMLALALALGAVSRGALGAGRASPALLRVVTADLPPLVMAPGGRQAGALRELLDALCARLGVVSDVAFMPWPRAVHLATTTPHTAIFPLTRLAAREDKFRWLAPLYEENYIFTARQDSGFDVQKPAAMTGKRIAMLRGAAQSAILRDMGFRRLVEASSIDEVHRFLLAGMADAAFGERAIVQRSLSSRDDSHQFQVGPSVRSTTAWLAGSVDFSEAEALPYRVAMAELVADGTQARIFRRYGLA